MDYENGYESYGGPPMKKVRGEEESHHAGMDRFLERQDEKIPPNHILLITVTNNKYKIVSLSNCYFPATFLENSQDDVREPWK